MDDRIKELNIPRGILIHEFSEITGISVEMLRDWHKKQILTANTNRGDGVESYSETLIETALQLFERQKYIDEHGKPPSAPQDSQRYWGTYEKLLDKSMLVADRDRYKDKIAYVLRLIEKVDFTKNLLFTHKLDIGNEVFLHGFRKHITELKSCDDYLKGKATYFKSYFMSTPADLVTINFSDKYHAITGEEPFPNIASFDDIRQDVLLVNIKHDSDTKNKDKSNYLLSLLENRLKGRIARDSKTPRLNWIFNMGADLTQLNKEYPGLYSVFTDPFRSDCKYYDLNAVDSDLKKKEQEQKKD